MDKQATHSLRLHAGRQAFTQETESSNERGRSCGEQMDDLGREQQGVGPLGVSLDRYMCAVRRVDAWYSLDHRPRPIATRTSITSHLSPRDHLRPAARDHRAYHQFTVPHCTTHEASTSQAQQIPPRRRPRLSRMDAIRSTRALARGLSRRFLHPAIHRRWSWATPCSEARASPRRVDSSADRKDPPYCTRSSRAPSDRWHL
jgi:hypothetical protein